MFLRLEQWLSWQEGLHPRDIDPGLDRLRQIAERCSLLTFPSSPLIITVTGTNGKGSCVALLESILRQAGHRVACYTSPHLLHYRERIRIDGQAVQNQQIVQAFSFINRHRADISLTYFEFSTLAAFFLFKYSHADIVILEVGLGGRLDAVNLLDADIAILSSIALDHQQWLGPDRASIALEKVGICRTGKPAVCGDNNPPAALVEHSKKYAIPLFVRDRDFGYEEQGDCWHWHNAHTHWYKLPRPALRGSFQLANAATVLQALSLLPDHLSCPRAVLDKALPKVHLTGRMQRLSTPFWALADIAHNPSSAAVLAEELFRTPRTGKRYALFGICADKALAATMAPLLPWVEHWYFAALPSPRSARPEKLQQLLTESGSTASSCCFPSLTEAWKNLLENTKKEDQLLVFGSVLTVSGVLREIQERAPDRACHPL